MMEQPKPGKAHHNSVFVASFDYIVVPDRTAWLCDIAHTALMRALDVVAKREERIGTERYVGHLV